MRSEIDHLVVACSDLEQGSRWLHGLLGVEPQAGGGHAAMGTHNRLLKLAARAYLELIAIDPQAAPPARPRWFDLDRADVRARAAQAPFLLTWVARTDAIVEAVTRVPELGEVRAASRADFTWRITIPDDGSLQFGGVLPSLIQWDGDLHPADRLEDRGCELIALELSYPAAAGVLPRYRELKIVGPVELATGPRDLAARIRTPRGEVVLR